MRKESALYIVATPIGNLGDISLRALEVLRDVAVVAAEDTRHSGRLLAHYAINVPLLSYHDHGGRAQVARILDRLQRGDSVALVSDAGTPLISDPGYRLVKAVRDAGFAVIPVPGACALTAALCASGIASDRFIFEGFPPAKQAARLGLFESVQKESRTLIYYESTHRIQACLNDMLHVFGEDRLCALARELTKTYETFLLGSLKEQVQTLEEDEQQRKGEFVVIVEGYRAPEGAAASAALDPATEKLLLTLADELPLKQAATLAAKITGEKKNKLYQWVVDRS